MARPDDPDRLASPTLAQLYLAQGHLARARQQVRAMLQREPEHRLARALQRRLRASEAPRLELTAERSLRLRWEIGPGRWSEDLHIVLVVTPRRSPSSPHYLSGPVRARKDSLDMPFPYPGGSASACLVRLAGERRELRVLAVADALSW